MRKGRQVVLTLLVLVFVLSLGTGVYGETWTPFAFEVNESFRYAVQWKDGDMNNAIYELTIDEGEGGNYKVKYSTEYNISPAELSSQMLFGFWGAYGPSLAFLFLNPMYEMLFSQLELQVGEKMSMYGQGVMEVVGTETIAGRNGYVCMYTGPEDELLAEWVIDPDLALPLRSRMYEDGEMMGQIELLDYEEI